MKIAPSICYPLNATTTDERDGAIVESGGVHKESTQEVDCEGIQRSIHSRVT